MVNSMKEFEDTLVRSLLYLKDASDDGGRIMSLLNPIWFEDDDDDDEKDFLIKLSQHLKPEEESCDNYTSKKDLLISQKNLRLIALMINKDTFVHRVFWNSFAESWGENVDVYLPFNTSELISILQKFNNDKANLASESEKKNHDALYNKLISFIGANGLLKKSSHTHIETPRELAPGIGAIAALNFDFFKDSIIKESHETLLYGFLAMQGISPLSGHGREEMMKKENSLNDKDLDFLKRNYLVNEVQDRTSYTLNKYLEHLNYEDLNQGMGQRLASLELHTEQLGVIIGKVKKLLNRLEKMQQPASDDKDFKPISTLSDYLRYNFKKLAYESGSNSKFLASIYDGNKRFFKDILDSPVFDKNPQDKNNVDLQLELMFETNRTDLDKIFIRAIEYLLDALRARRDVCKFLTIRRSAGEAFAQDFKISFASLSNLAELSTLRTLKNELTRKSSGLIKVSENVLNWGSNIEKADKSKREFIDMQSAFEWLTNTKRTATWKEAVIAPSLNKPIDYESLMAFGDNFQVAINESTKFSRTEKNSILSALELNKKKGSKVAKTLLEKFYEESNLKFSEKID